MTGFNQTVQLFSQLRGQHMTHDKIPELRYISYERRLRECGLITLWKMRLRGDQIFAWLSNKY